MKTGHMKIRKKSHCSYQDLVILYKWPSDCSKPLVDFQNLKVLILIIFAIVLFAFVEEHILENFIMSFQVFSLFTEIFVFSSTHLLLCISEHHFMGLNLSSQPYLCLLFGKDFMIQ